MFEHPMEIKFLCYFLWAVKENIPYFYLFIYFFFWGVKSEWTVHMLCDA